MSDGTARDPVEVFADIVDDFAVIMDSADRTVRRSLRYRASLLWVHAFAAMAMGPLFCLTPKSALQSPALVILREIPYSPVSVGLILLAGGLALGLGAVFDFFRLKVGGLILLGLWYFIIGLTITVPIFFYLSNPEKWPHPPFWGPILYMHLTVIMAVHIWGLLRKVGR